MDVADLDYELPERQIAQAPLAERDASRLLVLDRRGGPAIHDRVRNLAAHLETGDLLVLNDTRVIPARLHARRATGGAAEILLLEAGDDASWEALVKAGGSLCAGEVLDVSGGGIVLRSRLGEGRWRVEGDAATDLRALMDAHGSMPLPPYIRRAIDDPRHARDRERYQTLYARRDGAVAAPTAGLHLTPRLLAGLEAKGVRHAFVTLHVGLGTFAPVRTARLEDHDMHEEAYAVGEAAAAEIRRARAAGGRIVAVGTTVVRTLEAAARASSDGLPDAVAGRTRLLILPGYAFRAVDAMVTNFHLPRSTLLALVAAFAGRERILDAYRLAVKEGYRFYSYGDAMLLR